MAFSLSSRLKAIAESRAFNILAVLVIFGSSILVGLSTYAAVEQRWGRLIVLLDWLIIGFFCVEIAIRIGAEGRHTWRYFRDPWNLFDFCIVALCLLPFQSKAVAVLRLVRVMRVLRLFRAVPRLRMIISGLVQSLGSVGYVAALLFMLFYVFAVLGVSAFGSDDPSRFGGLGTAFFTLFQMLTLENWPDILAPLRGAHPLAGPAYFVIFIVLGTMVVMNLFVGVIVGGMGEAIQELKRETVLAHDHKAGGVREELDKIADELAKLGERVKALHERVKEQ